MMWTLHEAAARAGGSVQGADTPFAAVGTDSRADCAGQLFVALRGERCDGHDHVASAMRAGAVAAMVDHPLPLALPQWIVDDTRRGLGRLAAAWRDRFAGRVIAVTGSNGKTTVKEMIAAILAQAGRVRATQGNFNNDIGMPLTLLSARDEDFLVLELGANHPGEIAGLTALARPDLALITNAGRAHLEGFGSVEGVARAKGEIAGGLPPDGSFIVPGDAPWLPLWRALAGGRRLLTFAPAGPADLTAGAMPPQAVWNAAGFQTRFTACYAGQELPLTLALAGRHNVRNALAAAAVALALGLGLEPIRAGLAGVRPVRGRLAPRHCAGVRLIDDSYNANPDSLAAAIDVLAELPGRRWLVLGDLGELGPEARSLHAGAGRLAQAAGIEYLLTVGDLSAAASAAFGPDGRHFATQQPLIAALRAELTPEDIVLIKGSRRARMDEVVAALCAAGEDGCSSI